MATTKYIYPRVNISTNTMTHSSVVPEVEDTTRLFVPMLTEKGPSEVVTRVRNISEFSEIFGRLEKAEDFERNGQMALNLVNWLTNGGTAYIFRLNGVHKLDESGKITDDLLFANDKKAELLYVSGKATDAFKLQKGAIVKEKTGIAISVDALGEPDAEGFYKIEKAVSNNSIICVGTEFYSLSDEKQVSGAKYYKLTKITDINKLIYEVALEEGSDSTYILGKKADAIKDSEKMYAVLYYIDKIDIADTLALVEVYKWETSTESVKEIHSNAKYFGEYYNSVSVVVSARSASSFDLKVIYTDATTGVKTTVEEYQRLTKDSYKKALSVSEYIDAETFDITKLPTAIYANDAFIVNAKPIALKYSRAVDGAKKDLAKTTNGKYLLEYFWSDLASYYLENKLAFPIDMIMDAGYPKAVKLAMMRFICNAESNEDFVKRDDIVGIFDLYENGEYKNGISKAPSVDPSISDYADFKCTNIALYHQFFKINDSILTDSDLFVTPTYFLSKLIPYNDIQEGIQLPTAGIRRGVLDDAIFINENPLPKIKNEWFISRVNYVEKTPREYAFMSQRTFDGSSEDRYTALSFLNNERCLEKMKKDIERLGRDYLFEFNDSVTLAQMSNVLNRYITDWISNRTLSKGIVTVSKNPYSDEAVDVNLTIKFTGTIEVISVDITIE